VIWVCDKRVILSTVGVDIKLLIVIKEMIIAAFRILHSCLFPS
jgi:hypothetical protein